MRLGTDTGSLVNSFMAQTAATAPKVGDGATLLGWTDRTAATVIEVSPSGKIVKVQIDIAVRTDANGMDERQAYDYTPDPTGRIATARLTKRGWKAGSQGVSFGYRSTYYDFNF